MKKIRWGLLALSTLLVALPAFPQEAVFRVDVRLVPLIVTVRNPNDELVGGLKKEDFEIFDEGERRDVAVFERRSALPLSVALLLDASSSTGIKQKEEFASVERFLGAMLGEGDSRDSVALYSFNDEVTLRSSFTTRLKRVQESLKGIKCEGGTSMYDAMYLASGELERRDGRKVVVVVTDGGDTTSRVGLHEALKAMHYADAVLYGILVRPITNDPGRNLAGENALTLLAEGTGGKIFSASIGPSLDGVFNTILEELRTQYYIGFYPSGSGADKDRFHRVQVKVNQPGLRVSARSGYYESSH